VSNQEAWDLLTEVSREGLLTKAGCSATEATRSWSELSQGTRDSLAALPPSSVSAPTLGISASDQVTLTEEVKLEEQGTAPEQETDDVQEHWDGLGEGKRLEILVSIEADQAMADRTWAQLPYDVQMLVRDWLEPDEELDTDDEEDPEDEQA
jgi:hypothetical protein